MDIRIVILSASLLLVACSASQSSSVSANNSRHHPARISCQQTDVKPYVRIYVKGDYRYIDSNGIPASYGPFPNAGNPNPVCPADHHFRVPRYPAKSSKITWTWGSHRLWMGVALNGVPFEMSTNEYWHYGKGRETGKFSDWMYVATAKLVGLDSSNGHPQPPGVYHYHRLPASLYRRITNDAKVPSKMVLIGYAADGFPIYGLYVHKNPDELSSPMVLAKSGYQLKSGQRPAGDPPGNYDGTFFEDYTYQKQSTLLDECNGRYGKTSEYPQGIYYYVITENYPYLPLCLKGTIDASFMKTRRR
ncbi:MAG: YHYH protein [Pseudomonadota bacterium]